MPLILDTIVEEVGLRIKNGSFVWVYDEPTMDDLLHIHKEAYTTGFDVNHLKRAVLDDYTSGKARLVCKSGHLQGPSAKLYVKILALVYPDTVIPWDQLALIFKAVDKSTPFRVVWFASKKERLFPPMGKPDKGNVNGGYTLPCDTTSIVVYREQEFCRVLIHELLHATCTDTKQDIAEVEADTEVWAELFWVAILSKGHKRIAARLWAKQAQWISNQEYSLRGITQDDYVWRYTLGRRKALQELGIVLPPPDSTTESLSLSVPGLS